MKPSLSPTELEAYLDEALPPDEMARIEHALRESPELAQQLAAVNSRRDAGMHTLGGIWRRHRITCPTREQLGSYLLGALAQEMLDYVDFHIEIVGCRYCRANLADLKAQQDEAQQAVQTRRRKYFQSSAGYLRRSEK